MNLPPLPRFLFRWMTRLVLLLVFVGLPGTFIYLRQVGLNENFRDQVAQALSGEKFHTKIGRLLFDPAKGLIAEDVIVTTPDRPDRDLARIHRLVVSVALSDLLARKITIDFIELDTTDVSIPLGDQGEDGTLELKDVTAQCIFLAGQLRLSYFEADIAGLKIMLSGLLQNPQAFRLREEKAADGAKDATKRHEAFADILKEIAKLDFQGRGPRLRAEINGDLANPESIRVAPIRLRSGPIVAQNWRINGLELDAQYVNKTFSLNSLTVRGEEGNLNLSGIYQDGEVEFELSSNISLNPFLGLFPKDSPLRQLRFEEAPRLDAFGSLKLSEKPLQADVLGMIKTGRFSFKEAQVDSLSADFAWKDGRIFARDIELLSGEGKLSSDILFAPGDVRARLTNTIPPTRFISLFGPKEREFLELMEFKDLPYVQLEMKGNSANLSDISGQGSLKLGRTALRGSWMDSGEAKLEIGNKAVTYRDLKVTLGKGTGTGTFIYDFGRQEVRLEKINANLPPVEVLMWADPKIADALKPYRFHAPPRVQADGVVHMKDPTKTNLALKVQAAEGLDYEILKKSLSFGRTVGDVNIVGTEVRANIPSAALLGGTVGLKAVVSTDPAKPTLGADVTVNRVDFDRLTKIYFNYDDSKGVMTGNFKFTTLTNSDKQFKGTGNIRVEDGKVFAIPVLGPITLILDKIIPGSGYTTARQATADFKVGEGRISSENLVIEGLGFSLYAHGDVSFLTDRMNMTVRINAKGVPGIVLFPVSKLFEYVSTGTVGKPEWRPKIIHFGRDSGNP